MTNKTGKKKKSTKKKAKAIAGKTGKKKKTAKKKTKQTAAKTSKKKTRSAASKTATKKKATKKKANKKSAATHAPKPLYIVGIGASAGGLEAFEKLFRNMPANSGLGFVLVTHMDPTHKGLLVENVERFTDMPVVEAENGEVVAPDHVYVIPPGKDMAVREGRLFLLTPSPVGIRHPIDFFFRSLAEDMKEFAISVILSGTGSDGTLGMQAVKGEGGMTIIQDFESAAYRDMPRSAFSSGLVDYVSLPEKMGEQIIEYVNRASPGSEPEKSRPKEREGGHLMKIFRLIRNQSGHDFSFYKRNTILRRVQKRMSILKIDHLSDYTSYLERDKTEMNYLFSEFLIGVTSFFRGEKVFEVIRKKVVPALFKGRSGSQPLRVWVPGCSTGEEAYSLAILLKDYMDRRKYSYPVQIFATDIDPESIEKARVAVYPENIAIDVPRIHLKRYFMKVHNGYQIRKEIREMLIFASQSITKDPPFSRLDLISCRNLLIYINAELQKKVIPLFNYSLNPDGILILGPSETIGQFDSIFSVFDKKANIYQKKHSLYPNRAPIVFPHTLAVPPHAEEKPKPEAEQPPRTSLQEMVTQTLVESFTPPTVVVNKEGSIFHIHGHTGQYLEPAQGEATMNIILMAREGLKPELIAALRRADTTKKEVTYSGLSIKAEGRSHYFDLIVKPLKKPEYQKGLFLVAFHKLPALPKQPLKSNLPGESRQLIKQLEKELTATKEVLRHTIEEHEASSEELRSTNEELQSANEELQSTNEELETSREELQSVNEELITVNAELEGKVEELTRMSSDLKNLLASTEVGTLFLGDDMTIRRFTPHVKKVLNIIDADMGRPLAHISSNLRYDCMVEDAREVLETLVIKEMEMPSKDGSWYHVRIIPYRTVEKQIDGVVITFTDISDHKAASLQAEVVRDLEDAVILLNEKGEILSWNRAAEALYGYNESEALLMNITDIVPGKVKKECLALCKKGFDGKSITPFNTRRTAKNGKPVDVRVSVRLMRNQAGKTDAIAMIEHRLGKEGDGNHGKATGEK